MQQARDWRRARALQVRRDRLLCASGARAARIDDDRFARREVLEHALERVLLAEAAHLEPAVRKRRAGRDELVHLNKTGLNALDEIHRTREVGGPDRGGEG